MPKPQRELTVSKSKPQRQYSDNELSKFNNLIQKFYFDHALEHGKDVGKVVRVLDRKKLAIAYGAMSVRKINGVLHYSVIGDQVEGTERYNQFENIMEQLDKWKGRMSYGKLKNLDELENLAEQMNITNSEEFEF